MNYSPVGNTCPSIDTAIKLLEDAMSDLNDALKCDNLDDMKWDIEHAHSRLADIDLEDLRDQNGKLREWGENLSNKNDDLESEINELETKLQTL